ncbi:MAG: histidine phosphatase family protein [Polyangiaceae bacterium]|nr:histidine phosphatase family protein [Polyangiaceae bacterium]
MASTKLLLIRHGETEDNYNRVFQGQGGAGLNDRGKDQVKRLSARLLAPQRIHLHALYSSDLARARETAEILGLALGLPVTLEPGLREVDLGAWQGLDDDEVAVRFPDEWEAWKNGVDIKRGGGESYAEVKVRVAGALERLIEKHRGEAVGVVSHGAAIKVYVAHILGLPLGRLRFFMAATNTALNLIEIDERGARLVIWNDAAHLRDPIVEALASPP